MILAAESLRGAGMFPDGYVVAIDQLPIKFGETDVHAFC
jgi:hypothetical protein